MTIRAATWLTFLFYAIAPLDGQTTGGAILGRVYNARTGQGIEGVQIQSRHQETGETAETKSGALGYYSLLKLAPGSHWIRASKDPGGYQAREGYDIELYVAGQVFLNIPMRPLSDLYSQDQYSETFVSTEAIVRTYTTDLRTTVSQPISLLLGRAGTLYSTLSYVIDPRQVQNLPLSGRDVYATLVALPGVTADAATGRGLGVSVNGQRPLSSNYLLDGVENNDPLFTGPLTVIAPEVVGEYRISTNNYSSEFGRTGGFVANVVTRSGSDELHGVVYGYLNDTVLNANSYQHKAVAPTLPRQAVTEFHAGFWAGGKLIPHRQQFWSLAYERFRSRSRDDAADYLLPYLPTAEACGAKPVALGLLRQYKPVVDVPVSAANGDCTATVSVAAPIDFDRHLTLARWDAIDGKRGHWMLRAASSRFRQPYFAFSVYQGLSSDLYVDSTSLAASYVSTPRPSMSNDLRLSVRDAGQGWNRPGGPGVFSDSGETLPSSPLQSSFKYSSPAGEWNDSFTFNKGRLLLSAGFGMLGSSSQALLPFYQPGVYSFTTVEKFLRGEPDRLQVPVVRRNLNAPATSLTFDRNFRDLQFHGFLHATVRASQRGGVNFGLRYESFGAPENTGISDAYLMPGAGATLADRIAHATLAHDSGPRSLYSPDRNNWAPQVGVFYDLSGRGRVVARAAYSVSYDRPSQNLTASLATNSFQIGQLNSPPYPDVAAAAPARPQNSPYLVWIDAGLRTPYVQSWFGGIQSQWSPNFYVEASAQGALGRKLISGDVVNRAYSDPNAPGRPNPNLDAYIRFRSNSGSSSYSAATVLARYVTRRGLLQAAYTWGHSIDNQSDPLAGTFADLKVIPSNASDTSDTAEFSRPLDSRIDRGSSDFDQRHNVVVEAIQEIGLRGGSRRLGVLRNWQLAGILGIRSGFPVDLVAGKGLTSCPGTGVHTDFFMDKQRPSLVPGESPYLSSPVPAPGGFRLLNPAAFCQPGPTQVGNLGRNTLTGPRFWNADVSLAKAVPLRGDRAQLQFRVDAFNVMNHANLGQPRGTAGSPLFGLALLGRQGVQPSFPSLTPLEQLARRLQFQLKLVF